MRGSSQLNPEKSQKLGTQFFNKYGPCVRTIINLCLESWREEDHCNNIKTAAKHVAKNGSTVVGSIKDLDFGSDDVSSSLIFIRPESSEKRNIATVYIPTRFLINALTSAAANLNNLELHKLFSQLTMHPPQEPPQAGSTRALCMHN
jgi:hypothetical protein